MYAFIKTTVDDINITKVKSRNEKPKNQRQSYIWKPF